MTAGIDFTLDDTIAALASPPGGAWRSVIRVSGPACAKSIGGLFIPDDAEAWIEKRLPCRHTGAFQIEAGWSLPVAILRWPTARSYTGQPAAEIHLVGSPPLVEAVQAALFARGVRPARAGEFTLRAFLAGRVDLLQAEAVLGVIDADDSVALRAALAQLAGGISNEIARLHEQLLLDLADLEAGLDFVEEDIDFIDRAEFAARLQSAAAVIDRLLDQADQRLQSNPRVRVVLAGLPNAGKSTLFNALTGRDSALVSAIPGTTRDYLSANLNWFGSEIELLDTAGCADDDGDLMQSAHLLRDRQLRDADVILWCTPADATEAERELSSRLSWAVPQGRLILVLCTKAELAPSAETPAVSAVTGAGLDELRRSVVRHLQSAPSRHELIGSSAARCRDSLRSAGAAIQSAHQLAVAAGGDELIAAELRAALEHTGRIAGRVYTDDILDRIFSRFCIGK